MPAVKASTLARRARARALGIPYETLRSREARARNKKRPLAPAVKTWIGARIWPPLEASHPLTGPLQNGCGAE